MRKKEMLVIVLLASLFLQIAQAAPTPPFLLENIQTKIETTNVTIKWETTQRTRAYAYYVAAENFTQWGIKWLPMQNEDHYNTQVNEREPSRDNLPDYLQPFKYNHTLVLKKLKPNTTYLVKIKSQDDKTGVDETKIEFTTESTPDSFFRRGDIVFQDLTVTPEEISGNVSIQFKITNNWNQEENIGFILEHYPPTYLIIHEENMTLKYFQYAKSVIVRPNQTIIYKYTLRSSNYYHGVNSIIINYQGRQTIPETFTVNDIKDVSSIAVDSIGSDSQSTSLTTRTYLENILEVLALILALIVLASIVFRVRRDKA